VASPDFVVANVGVAMRFLSALVQSIFTRGFVIFIFTTITIIVAIQTMLKTSVALGISILGATALTFFAVGTFVGSFLARREKNYRALDLIGIGSIAAVLIFCGFAVGYWSPFQINIEGYAIGWFDWLVIGMVAALFVTRKQDAL
jgi:hypothetical protein